MIVFNRIRFKNILSVGNYFVEVPLDKFSNIIVSGQNGSGKSTLLDAMCFSLYGRPFRAVNKGDIVNSINGKLVTEIEFTKGADRYKVVRGQKPTIFQIFKNDSLIEEDSHSRDYQKYLETSILGMTYKSFTQVVVLGSAVHTPFMQLKTPERRALIESLLDLEIFSAMNVIAKQKLADIKDEIRELETRITKKEVEIESKERYIKKIEDESDSAIEGYLDEIATHKTNIDTERQKRQTLSEKISSLDQSKITVAKTTLKTQSSAITKEKGSMEYELKDVQKRLNFLLRNDTCPTCSQVIHADFKDTSISECHVSMAKLEAVEISIKEKESIINEKLSKLDEAIQKIQTIERQIQNSDTEISKHIDRIEFFNKEIRRIEQVKDLKQDKDDLKNFNLQLKDMFKEKETLQQRKGLYEISLILLKDTSVKAEIIKSYIPLINQIINEYLLALDMFVKFELDENFEESLKGRHIDHRTYFSFSEGEKRRIDISILFMFREIARRRNTAATNLLIMDEILDSALDAHGSEMMVKMLKKPDTNNVIISHHENVLESFTGKDDQIITVEKKGNFTHYNF